MRIVILFHIDRNGGAVAGAVATIVPETLGAQSRQVMTLLGP